MFWPFTVWINCSSDLKSFANSRPSASNFKSFSHRSSSQNNFGNKIQFFFAFVPNPNHDMVLNWETKRREIWSWSQSYPAMKPSAVQSQASRNRGGGQGGSWHPLILANQLIVSQPGGNIMSTTLLLPPRFFNGPAKYVAVPNTKKVDPTDHAFMTKSSSHIYFSGFLSSKTHSTVR